MALYLPKTSRNFSKGGLFNPRLVTQSGGGGFLTYDAAVLSNSPLIYFPQRESSGTVATDAANGYNGTYTSVTLNSTQWVNGDNAPLYATAGNRLNFLVAGFTDGFNGDEGHFSTWIKINSAGVWTDGTARNVLALIATSTFQLLKHSVSNTIRLYRASDGTTVDLQFTTRALGWINLQVRWKAGEFVRLYYEGVLVAEDTSGIGAWVGALSAAQLGTYTAVWQGNIGPSAVYTSSNTDSFVTTLATVPSRVINMMSHVICDGDSLTLGGHESSTPYPTQLQDLLDASIWDMRNFGVSGQTSLQLESDAATQVDIWSNTVRPRQIVVCWAGSNDIAASTNAATVQGRIQTYCANRQAAGFEVVVCSILPRSGIGGGNETTRTTVNTWLASNYASFADGFVDLAADTRLDDYTDTTYFAADATHLNNTGYGVVAELVETAINP